jgi:hypothetical protein
MEMSCPTNSGGYKIAPKNSNIKEDLIRVFQDKLDNFYTLDKPIQFIKIDVEGYEMEVLKGGEQTIRKHMPTMVIELNDMNLKNQNSSAKEVVKLIEGIGYKEVINLKTMKTLEDSVLDNCCIDILCKSHE